MSQVRMCDKCGNIFKEDAEGAETYTATRIIRNEYGHRLEVTETLDACPQCSFRNSSVQPRVAISPSPVTLEKIEDTLAQGVNGLL